MAMDMDWEYKWKLIEEYALERVYRECGLESAEMYGVWPGGRRSGRTYRMLVRVMLTAMQHDLWDIDVVVANQHLANELCRWFNGIVSDVCKVDMMSRTRVMLYGTKVNFVSLYDFRVQRAEIRFYDHTVNDMNFIQVGGRSVGRTHRINEIIEIYKRTGVYIKTGWL